VVENGVLVGDPNRTFRMVTLGFLADGGDSYYPLTLASGRANLAPTSGNTFLVDGSEQWALAAYLTNIQVFSVADTAPTEDQRIQNLSQRTDTVTGPRMLSVAVTATDATLRFVGVVDLAYQVQASTNLTDWVNLGWASDLGGGLFQFVDLDKPAIRSASTALRARSFPARRSP
jgi:hypothetical protein